MVFRQLRLYDVVTDLLPGVATVVLLIPLFPEQSFVARLFFSGKLLSGATLLFAGYLFGRAVNLTSNVAPVRRVLDILDGTFVWLGLHQRFAPGDVERRIRSGEESDDTDGTHYGSTSFQDLMANDSTPETVSQRACRALAETFEAETDVERYAATEEFGKSLLHRKGSLYRRYEMMAVMFRAFAFVFLVFAVLYAANSVAIWAGYESIWTTTIDEKYPHYLVSPVFAVLTYPTLHQWWLFRQRAAEAFVNDLYMEMIRSDVVELSEDFRLTVGDAGTDGTGDSR